MLKFQLLGQLVPFGVPDVVITGDPSVDNGVITAAGYAAGIICGVKVSATSGRGQVIYPIDGATLTQLFFGTLVNGAGNYAESIGPSGSGKMTVVRNHPIFDLFNETSGPQAYDSTKTYHIGDALYCDAATGQAGRWTNASPGTGALSTGICLHVPTTSEPWLGVAQTF